MSQFRKQPYLLSNPIQHYQWGSKGKSAYIPSLLGFEPEDDLPYAELWIGSHPKASSKVLLDGTSIHLENLVDDHPLEILGSVVASKYGRKFPFLLKILSAADILSIQVHPTKEQAISLHAEDPLHYPDDNHKPELAIALDSLSALVGFKAVDQVNISLAEYPELTGLLIPEIIRGGSQKRPLLPYVEEKDLESFFSTILGHSGAHRERIIRITAALYNRLSSKTDRTEVETLFIQLYPVYPGDVGLCLLFLMNLVHLKNGQAIFLGAGIPHAYVRGNIIECMANSDNVVRAGLTEKFKDIKSLTRIVDLRAQPVFVPEKISGSEVAYITPADEFQVSRIILEKGSKGILIDENSPVVLLILRGIIELCWELDGKTMSQTYHQGNSVLIPAFLDTVWVNSEDYAELVKAMVPGKNLS